MKLIAYLIIFSIMFYFFNFFVCRYMLKNCKDYKSTQVTWRFVAASKDVQMQNVSATVLIQIINFKFLIKKKNFQYIFLINILFLKLQHQKSLLVRKTKSSTSSANPNKAVNVSSTDEPILIDD